MLMKRKCLYLFIAASFLFIFKPAFAEDPGSLDKPWEKASLNLGYFISDLNTDIRIGSGVGVAIDVEKALGLDTTNSIFRIDALWRFTDSRRHRLNFTWLSFDRDGLRTIGQDIEYEDKDGNIITIPLGTQVTSEFDLDIYKLAYSYSFFQDNRMDLAASVGLYTMPINFGLQATGLIDANASEKFTAPLPTLGLRADFAITPKWFIRTGFEVLYLKINEFKGSIYEGNAAVEFLPWKHLGFGLGYNIFDLQIEADGEDYPQIDLVGEIEFRYSGVLFYAKLFF
jgi:hypothetical protein